MKNLWMLIIFFSMFTAVIESVTTTMFYCCSPMGNCVAKGYNDMSTCQQACAGGDEHYRCEPRETAVAPIAPIAPTALTAPIGPVVSSASVTPIIGRVEAISSTAQPVVAGAVS